MNGRGRPKKVEGTAYDNRKNVRLPDRYAEMLKFVAAHDGTPAETLLRRYAYEGIRKDYAALKNDPSIMIV